MTIKTILNTLEIIIADEKLRDDMFEKENKDIKFIEMVKYFHSVKDKEYINLMEEGDDEPSPYKNPFAYVRVLDVLEAILAIRKLNITYYN